MTLKFISKLTLLLVAIQFSSLSYAQTFWVDVRSVGEYATNNIKGDINIPYTDIVEGIKKMAIGKDSQTYLYCRSGRRASVALSALQNAHYTNVSNEGGIDDVRIKRDINK